MGLKKVADNIKSHGRSMRTKLTLSLSSIAVILLISSVISILEYSRMSSYVSDLIADDISSINVARKLSDMSNAYNLSVLAVIGDETSITPPDFNDGYFRSHCDSLRSNMASNSIRHLADSVMYSYSAYMLTSLELSDVLQSSFIDSRSWYFERLQPRFVRLTSDIDALSTAIYRDLERDSATFERGFYRSIIPGVVAVGVGLLLVLMLLFFILAYYVNPIYRMLDSAKAYRDNDKDYTYEFEGDDQLVELNTSIRELTDENRSLRQRIKMLKSRKQQPESAAEPEK